jgi:hypothetical protein
MGNRRRRRPWKPPVTMATPTPERQAKNPFGWEITKHAGEQVSFRNKSALEHARPQMTEAEYKALEDFSKLAEQALCPDTSKGLDGVRIDGGQSALIMSGAKRQAYTELVETCELRPGRITLGTLCALVLGFHKEANGALMRWRDRETTKGGGLVAMRCAAEAIQDGRKRWRSGVRAPRKRYQAGQQEAFEHGLRVERLEHEAMRARRQRLIDNAETFFKIKRQEPEPAS